MKYTVYANQVEEVTKRLDRMAKKAARYGIPFSYTVGEEHPVQIAVQKYDDVNHHLYTDKVVTVAGVDFDLDCEELIRASGWKVLAHIEHGDLGNIVTGIGCDSIKNEWYMAPARCDHCNTNRKRTVTFIVENENGEQKQVGKSCLKEYTGISPDTAIMWAELRGFFPEMEIRDGWTGFASALMDETKTVLAYAYDSIKKDGYGRRDSSHSTFGAVLESLRKGPDPSKEGMEAAEKMIDWLKDVGDRFDREDSTVWKEAGDLERNCVPFARSGFVKRQQIGRLCYIPVAYSKHVQHLMETERKREARKKEKDSEYVGKIGERIKFVATTVTELASWDTQYGRTFLYKMTDEAGNVFIWFASGCYETGIDIEVTGTVKDHNEREGVKQTILTRCKFSIK